MILSVDLGTTYFKGGLFDRSGSLCAFHRMPTPIDHPQKEHWEIAPERFLEAITQVIAALAASTPDGLAQVAAVSFSTQSNSLLLLDAQDRPLVPLIIWADERALPFEDQLRELSQTPGFQRTTGVPHLNSQYAAAKLLWLRCHRPQLWQRAKRLCLISDYLTLWLTGRHVTEAGASGLLGMADIHRLAWWPKVYDQLEVPSSWLPTIVRAGTDLGRIRPQIARALALPPTCRFVVGCLDQYAGAIGLGNTSSGGVSETTGTVLASLRYACGSSTQTDPAVFQGPGPDPGAYYQMVFGSTSANLLEWYRNNLPGRPDFESLSRAAADIPPGAGGLKVVPGAEKGDLDQGFAGGPRPYSTGQAVRSIMEAVAFALADQVGKLAGSERPVEIRSGGGAARSDVWLQVKADVLGIPFVATTCPAPAGLGAAMLAARALGWGGLKDLVCDWVRTKPPQVPNRAAHQFYRASLPALLRTQEDPDQGRHQDAHS